MSFYQLELLLELNQEHFQFYIISLIKYKRKKLFLGRGNAQLRLFLGIFELDYTNRLNIG